jgi:hypothetical protein
MRCDACAHECCKQRQEYEINTRSGRADTLAQTLQSKPLGLIRRGDGVDKGRVAYWRLFMYLSERFYADAGMRGAAQAGG